MSCWLRLLTGLCPCFLGGALSADGRPVCPSVTKSRTKGHIYRKLKICRKEAHDTMTPFRGRKVKGQGHQADYCRDQKSVISSKREGYTNFKLGKWMERDDPHHRHGRWSPTWNVWVHLQVTITGAGAYCGGRTAGAAQIRLYVQWHFRYKFILVLVFISFVFCKHSFYLFYYSFVRFSHIILYVFLMQWLLNRQALRSVSCVLFARLTDSQTVPQNVTTQYSLCTKTCYYSVYNPESLSILLFSFWHTRILTCLCNCKTLMSATQERKRFFPPTTADIGQPKHSQFAVFYLLPPV